LNCELAETTVHGYFDGELDAVRSAEFEHHLETCPECQAELRDIQSLRKQIQESELFAQASSELRDRIREQITRETNPARVKLPGSRRLFVISALGALAAVAALAVIFTGFQSHNQSTRISAELIDAHVRSLQPGHLTDVLSTDQHTVKPWFDGKLEFIPPVADFSQQGFPLVGGRLDVIDGHNVASVVYSRRKHLINLFVWPYEERETNLAASGSRKGYNWLGWRSNDLQFCLISDVSTPDLRELKDLVSH
jgi:anti-sigma factor RsiW